jgi:hypothetical protein
VEAGGSVAALQTLCTRTQGSAQGRHVTGLLCSTSNSGAHIAANMTGTQLNNTASAKSPPTRCSPGAAAYDTCAAPAIAERNPMHPGTLPAWYMVQFNTQTNSYLSTFHLLHCTIHYAVQFIPQYHSLHSTIHYMVQFICYTVPFITLYDSFHSTTHCIERLQEVRYSSEEE